MFQRTSVGKSSLLAYLQSTEHSSFSLAVREQVKSGVGRTKYKYWSPQEMSDKFYSAEIFAERAAFPLPYGLGYGQPRFPRQM